MGSVVISVDAELGWGLHDLDSPPSARIESARTGWERLVDCFDEFRVPATWAVVGHLFLDDCDGEHADHPAPEGWFARERGSWRTRPDLRFGPDLIKRIEDATVAHEIGCHSFSHVPFEDPRILNELACAEIDASVRAARAYGGSFDSFDSFVFPRNVVGHRAVLAERGFSCYRGVAPARRVASLPGARPLGKLARATLAQPLVVTPQVDEFGLVDIPASLFLFGFEGRARTVIESVWDDPIIREARRGIDAAAGDDGVFHLWLHPNDLTEKRDTQRLRAILGHITERRDETALAVETMRAVAARTTGDGAK